MKKVVRLIYQGMQATIITVVFGCIVTSLYEYLIKKTGR